MEKKCNNCGTENKMILPVPYLAHESAMARAERTQKRLVWIIVLLIVLFVGSNFAWLVYENSFEDVVITQENADGYNNYIGNDGDINNGETNNSDKTEEKEK